jgi:hypothetical protein
MMDGDVSVAMLLTLMRELQEVMRTEGALLREMRLERIQALQLEKSALAERYERVFRKLRASPGLVAELTPEERLMLEQALRQFQAAVSANAERLGAAKRVSESVLQVIRDGLDAVPPTLRGYPGAPRTAGAWEGARVIPVAFDRQC